jgi:phospholipase C
MKPSLSIPLAHLRVAAILATLCASSAFATVTVTSPTNKSTDTSPVHFVATATASTCSTGVASMGIYLNNTREYVVDAASLNTSLTVSPGSYTVVVQEWDKCGGSTTATLDITVVASVAPTVTITADSPTVAAGSASTLTVKAANATTVTISGGGDTYTLAATGGTVNVTPTQTTPYTAEATSSKGTDSAEATVTVIAATSVDAIKHVVFMLQENHTFDDYFGMLNPYRKTNGWDVSEDGKTYTVDGIDDKLDNLYNDTDSGTKYSLFKFTTTCIDDMSSAWLESYGDVSRWDFATTRPINMDGFVHTAEGFAASCNKTGASCSGSYTDTTGQRAMGYYDEGFLNYYYYMASQFALSDRWFSPVSSKSVDNRIATFTGGTTQGLVHDPGSDDHLPQLDIANIFQKLDAAKVTWKVYYTVTMGQCLDDDDCGTSGDDRFPGTDFNYLTYSNQYMYDNPSKAACKSPTVASSAVGDTTNSFCIDPNHVAPLSQYYADLKDDTLPSFAFIEAGYGNNDEHPGSGQSILEGQAEVASIVNGLMTSTSWSSSAFFLSWDEGGGPYDHVPPVPGSSNKNTDASLGSIPDIAQIAVNPDTYKPCVPSGGTPTLHCDLDSSDPGATSTDAPAVNGFDAQLGFRLPNMIISPFTRKHYVSHTPMDHTAVIKFVESRFIGSSTYLTNHDKAQPDLLEFFDFTAIPWSTPPTPPTPASSTSLGYNPCTSTSMGGS